jgi:hypothetical protein
MRAEPLPTEGTWFAPVPPGRGGSWKLVVSSQVVSIALPGCGAHLIHTEKERERKREREREREKERERKRERDKYMHACMHAYIHTTQKSTFQGAVAPTPALAAPWYPRPK